MIGSVRKLALEYLKRAYCPYSRFPVVEVLYAPGRTVVGVNVENASYGLTVCAERVAVFKAVSEGLRDFDGIFIYSPESLPYPCGACRQVMAEFFPPDFSVTVSDGSKEEVFSLGELIPFAFEL